MESSEVLREEINGIVADIRALVSRIPSLWLLHKISDLERVSGSEAMHENAEDTIMSFSDSILRRTEYIQSLVAVQGEVLPGKMNEQEFEVASNQLFVLLDNLEEKLAPYAFAASSEQEDASRGGALFDAELMYMVRGKRYTCVNERFLHPLVQPHDAELRKLFGVGSDEVMEGFTRLQKAVGEERFVSLPAFREAVDQYYVSGSLPSGDDKQRLQTVIEDLFSTVHFDVARITGWPDKLIAALSWVPGEARWRDDQFDCWPIVAMPVCERPFIRLGNASYCFEPYCLTDNFYRNLQYAVWQADPEYKFDWNKGQKKASETLVAQTFQSLLPGAKLYTNVRYGSKKGTGFEGDIIVWYSDLLLIVEVKAGSFTSKAPLIGLDDQDKRYADLLSSPAAQCEHFLNYMKSCKDVIKVFNDTWEMEAEIPVSAIAECIPICVMLENVNSVAARAEKSFRCSVNPGTLAIAVDDLLTYDMYFDSPTRFVHFLRQRQRATHEPKLQLNDELDHLGMYIEHNVYSMEAQDIDDGTILICDGYRNQLDHYFNLYGTGLEGAKPERQIPSLIHEFISYLDCHETGRNAQLAAIFLDADSASLNDIALQIQEQFKRQRLRGCLIIGLITLSNGDVVYTQILSPYLGGPQPTVNQLIHRVQAHMVYRKQTLATMLTLTFSREGHVCDVGWDEVDVSQIDEGEREQLREIGEKLTDAHAGRAGKVGRNEPCPCGSGLKYKKCHGR